MGITKHMTTPQSKLLDKTFTGSTFALPAELEKEFDDMCRDILAAQKPGSEFRLAQLWVAFYMKFDAYYTGVVN